MRQNSLQSPLRMKIPENVSLRIVLRISIHYHISHPINHLCNIFYDEILHEIVLSDTQINKLFIFVEEGAVLLEQAGYNCFHSRFAYFRHHIVRGTPERLS